MVQMGCDVKEKEVPKECNGKVGSGDKIEKKPVQLKTEM